MGIEKATVVGLALVAGLGLTIAAHADEWDIGTGNDDAFNFTTCGYGGLAGRQGGVGRAVDRLLLRHREGPAAVLTGMSGSRRLLRFP